MKPTPCLLSLAVLVTLSACGGKAAPPVQEPAEAFPLPPLSATPIGLLIHHQSELELRSDQVAKLEALDVELADANAPFEAEIEEMEPRRAPDQEGQSGRGQRGGKGGGGGGMRGGGGAMGGGGGGMRGGGGGGGQGGAKAGGAGKRPEPTPEMKEKMAHRRERAQELRQHIHKNNLRALHDALGLLDSAQRERAERILEDIGVERSNEKRGRSPFE